METQNISMHELPHIEVPAHGFDLEELMDATARLADLLEEETHALQAMELDAVAKLHAKKLEITQLLESYQKQLKVNPDMLKGSGAGKLEEFSKLADDLTEVMEENFRRTAVARAVNQRIMQTIIETVSEHNRPGTYNRYGNSALQQDLSLSLNLNQKA